MYYGDGCYTWEQIGTDALLGALGGVAFRGGGLGIRAISGSTTGMRGGGLGLRAGAGKRLNTDQFVRRAKDAADRLLQRRRNSNLTGGVRGTRGHNLAERYARRVDPVNSRGLEYEISWLNGQPVPRGTPGSSRPDVRDPATGTIYDYKFGSGGLPSGRRTRQLNYVPNSPAPNIRIVRYLWCYQLLC